MAETPLLPIDGPALVFGGPYGNLQATAAVLRAGERRGIPPSRIICTGDLVAYGGDPVATIALVRDAGLPRRIDLDIGEKRLAVIHGSVSRINQFVFASTAAATKRRELALAGA